MKYMSSRSPVEKDVPEDVLKEVNAYIKKEFPGGIKMSHQYGDIHDALLDFRMSDGRRLLINQLAPIYLALCWQRPLA